MLMMSMDHGPWRLVVVEPTFFQAKIGQVNVTANKDEKTKGKNGFAFLELTRPGGETRGPSSVDDLQIGHHAWIQSLAAKAWRERGLRPLIKR